MADGAVGFGKMTSVFAALRLLGTASVAAYAVQALVAAMVAALVVTHGWRKGWRPGLAALVLAGAPLATPFVLDYVVAHEVAHLREMNHSPRFWTICRALAPRTDEARSWLTAHGAGLHRLV